MQSPKAQHAMDSTASVSYERHSASDVYGQQPEPQLPASSTDLPPAQRLEQRQQQLHDEHHGSSSPSSPPAGSIDPSLVEPLRSSHNAGVSSRPVRKRNRKALSCKPCRNMKVKCDRSMPCDRCVKNNRVGDCVYDGEPESKKVCIAGTFEDMASGKAHPPPKQSTKFGPLDKFSLHVQRVGTAITHYKRGKARYVGGTHWVHLFGEFEEIGPWYLHRMKDFAAARKEVKYLKKCFKNKHRNNFPFGGGPAAALTMKEMPALLPLRHMAEMYVKRYMETFEATHPLFHEPTFRRELDAFWQQISSESCKDACANVGPAWLSSLFMMMFLGCWFMPLSQETERHRVILDKLLDGAQACMVASSLRARNTIDVVRAYCMVILAKQCDALSHDDSNVVSVTVATVTQIAMMAGVHRDPDYFKDMPPVEKFVRRRAWNTILYMNFQNSMDGGMPFLLGPSVYDCPPPLNQNENDVSIEVTGAPANENRAEAVGWHGAQPRDFLQHPLGVVTDSTHQIILRSVLSIGTEIITPLNNADAEILPYDAVMKYDYRLTRILDELPRSLSPDRYGASGSRLDYRSRLSTQRQMVEFFIRSILLVLHRPYAQGAESREQYPNSYYTSLQHSTIYINARRQLFLDKTINSVNGIWLAEIFKEMFTLAFLLCYADIRRRDGIDIQNDDKYKCIVDSQQMSEQESVISEHHFQLYIATALKIPSLFADKDGKNVIFSEEYVAKLNAAIRNAAQKVRANLGLPPKDTDEQNNGNGDGKQSVQDGVPATATNTETATSGTPQVMTPDDPAMVARIRNALEPQAGLLDKNEQSTGGEEYGAMPSELFDSLMNDPNLILDEFFTSFVFGGFQ